MDHVRRLEISAGRSLEVTTDRWAAAAARRADQTRWVWNRGPTNSCSQISVICARRIADFDIGYGDTS